MTGLDNATDYYFRVYAINTVGVSAASGASTKVTTADTPDAPGRPSRTAKTTSSLTVAWGAPSSDGGSPVTSYTVEYKRDSRAVTTWSSVSTTDRFAELAGLSSKTDYLVRVIAVNAVGSSAASSSLATSTD